MIQWDIDWSQVHVFMVQLLVPAGSEQINAAFLPQVSHK